MVGTWSKNWIKVKINHKPRISNTIQVSAEPHTVTLLLQEAVLLWLGRQTKLCKYAMPVTRTYLLIYNYTNRVHMAPALLQHGWTKLKFIGRSSLFPWNKQTNKLKKISRTPNKNHSCWTKVIQRNVSRWITVVEIFHSYVHKSHTLKIYNNHVFVI